MTPEHYYMMKLFWFQFIFLNDGVETNNLFHSSLVITPKNVKDSVLKLTVKRANNFEHN